MTVTQHRPTPHTVVSVGTRIRSKLQGWLPWLFLLPILVLNVVVILGPAVTSIAYAFTEWPGIGTPTFIGLGNFIRLLTDSNVHQAFLNNVQWTLMNLILAVGMGLFGASLLSSVRRFTVPFRLSFFLPYVLGTVIITNVWRTIYDPMRGLGPYLSRLLDMPFLNIKPLGSPDIVLYAVYLADLWHWWGFLVVLYLAAVQAIDAELYEIAIIEGASRWQQFWYVTIPGILPTLVFSSLQTIIWSFKSFDYVYLMTRGGPGHASDLLATLSYRFAFREFEVGYAASIGLLLSFVALLATAGFVALRRGGWDV